MKIDLFLLPYTFTLEYWGLKPSACSSFPESIHPMQVPADNLLTLFLTQPWSSKRRILCIHWSTELYGSKYILKSLFLLLTNFIGLVALKFFNAVKVVWVLHNYHAHDYPHPVVDQIGIWLMERSADVIVAQQKETERELKIRLPKKNVVYIPHTNFVGAYGPRVEKSSLLRDEFKLSPDDVVLLSFGAIRPYKKIESIIDSVSTMDTEIRKKFVLVVAGKGSAEYISLLKNRAGDSVRLYIREGFVEDSEVPSLLASADYSIFYFDNSERTSGSLLVALSYGSPVIARAIPGAEDIDGSNGYTFKNEQELQVILKKITEVPTPSPEQVVATVAPYSINSVENAYRQVYESIT